MEAKQRKIMELFSQPNTQFTIPVYQRDYNWEEKQCKVLYNDIQELSKNRELISHFIGSIVYIHEGIYATGIKEFSIIDGQQRMITLTLLFLAMCHSLKKHGRERTLQKIFKRYIIDEYMERESKLKLIPPEENFNILNKIAFEKFDELERFRDRNMVKNYQYFIGELENFSEEELENLLDGMEKLIYVDIALEKGKDNPQKIFESLNSTGLDLSQGDLIRNYILMELTREEQNKIYKNIWIPIEENCKISDGIKIKSYISDFIRDYLTLKNNKISNKAKVFEEFKEFYKSAGDILDEMKKYSEIYSLIRKPQYEKDREIQKKLFYLKSLDQSVVNPFLMGIINDYKNEYIIKEELLNIFDLLESYLWRRYITGEPSNALNKIFMNLYSKVSKDDYYNSFSEIIIRQGFPTDEELKYDLKVKSVYKDREKLNYVFEKIENYNHNELIDFQNEKITIEHVFPQKPGRNWISLFSKEEFEQMKALKDTISNLTLTGSNQNLGSKSFLEKKNDPQHGYANSKLYLNKWLGQQKHWNILKMNERFEILFADIIKIWKRPQSDEKINMLEITFFIKGLKTSGSGKLKGNNFIVLKGSSATKEQYKSVEKSNLKIIKKLLKEKILRDDGEKYIFEKDYMFSSPNLAAKLIQGKSVNGWTEWKTFDGKLINEYRKNKF